MRKLLAVVVAFAALMTLSVAAFAINGVVVNTKGKPMAGTKVFVYADDKNLPEKSNYKILRADAKGRFSYQQRQGFSHYYFAEVNGYAYSMVYRGKANFKKNVRIKLWPEKKIYGRVVDSKGKPVSGAAIRIRVFSFWDSPADERKQLKPWFWFGTRVNFAGVTMTGKDGRFTLRHIPNTSQFNKLQMRLEVKAPGHTLVDLSFNKKTIAKYLKITDPLASTLSGTVYLPGKAGTAPEGLELVSTYGSPKTGYRQVVTKTGKNGKFIFADLPTRLVNITLPTQGRHYTEDGVIIPAGPVRQWTLPVIANVKIKPEQKNHIDLQLVQGALIRGKVVDQETGKLASGGYINVKHAGRADTNPDNVEINSKGEFALRVPPGNVRISLDYARMDGRYVSTRTPENLDFTVANGDDKSDVILKFEHFSTNDDYSVMSKPVPAGFELKPGTYQLTWDPEVDSSVGGYYLGRDNDKSKFKMSKLPKLISKNPLYMSVPFDGLGDDGLLLALFDESKGTGKGFDIAYVDLNRNGDLTDDEPTKWTASKSYATTPWALAQSRQGTGAEQTNNPVMISWQISSGRSQELLRKGGWKGTIDSSKGPISAIVVDSNNNGLFNDAYKYNQGYTLCDYVYADTNGFGRAVALPYLESPQMLSQGTVNLLAGKGYIVKANAAGNSITVEPYTGQFGTLLVRASNIAGQSGVCRSLNVTGEPGRYSRPTVNKGAVMLPVGKYTLSYCTLELGSGSKKTALNGIVDKVITVEPDKQTVFTITGKPKMAVYADKREVILTAKKSEPISWQINIGDSFKNVTLSSSGKVAPKVGFDKSGAMLAVEASGGG
ncbi:MAG: carboxypeptidase-like regulatory domain-containing protein [Armatimonadetes bacterium]|nr:carboxypeptidase-like regulatory domain-containing protein [Armatimonadota bacterium]